MADKIHSGYICLLVSGWMCHKRAIYIARKWPAWRRLWYLSFH